MFENRDLMPTADVRAVAKGILTSHLGLGAGSLDRVFPDGDGVSAMPGLICI
jgi:uncharacterized protein (DUF1501 family)